MGVARVVELVCAADVAKDSWEEAFNVAVEARQYAVAMQDAAEKAVDLAQVAQAGCKTAQKVAKGTANLAATPFFKKRKHRHCRHCIMVVVVVVVLFRSHFRSRTRIVAEVSVFRGCKACVHGGIQLPRYDKSTTGCTSQQEKQWA